MEQQQKIEKREACVKVLNGTEFVNFYNKLKTMLEQEGGWIFRGENMDSSEVEDDCGGKQDEEDKGNTVLDQAKEFTSSIDDALHDAYCVDRRCKPIGDYEIKSSEKRQRVIWAIKYTALIRKVRDQFKAKVTDDDDVFCERQKEDSIIQGNKHNVRLPKGVVPVPLYDYGYSIGAEEKRWLLIPYTTYSFIDNLSAALCINRYKLENYMEESLTKRTALRVEDFVCLNTRSCVAVKIVFLEEMRTVVLEYLRGIEKVPNSI